MRSRQRFIMSHNHEKDFRRINTKGWFKLHNFFVYILLNFSCFRWLACKGWLPPIQFWTVTAVEL